MINMVKTLKTARKKKKEGADISLLFPFQRGKLFIEPTVCCEEEGYIYLPHKV